MIGEADVLGHDRVDEQTGAPVSSTSLDSREPDLASAREILARLERYVAIQRAANAEAGVATPTVASPVATTPAPAAPAVATHAAVALPNADEHLPRPRRRLQPATIDLFPYDLSASVVGCALTIMAYISFGRPIALAVTVGLIVLGSGLRLRRWFPSVGVNLVIGTIVGILFVFTA